MNGLVTRPVPLQYVLGDKEKSKVLASVDTKLLTMRSIKEVTNESDRLDNEGQNISNGEEGTVNSEDDSNQHHAAKRSKRPVLVKQKHTASGPLEEEATRTVVAPGDCRQEKGKEGGEKQQKSFEDLKEEVKSMPPFSLGADWRKSSSDDPSGTSARTSLSMDEAADQYGDLPTIVSSLSRFCSIALIFLEFLSTRNTSPRLNSDSK